MFNKLIDWATYTVIRVEILCWCKMQDLEQELLKFMIIQDIELYRKELNAGYLPVRNNATLQERSYKMFKKFAAMLAKAFSKKAKPVEAPEPEAPQPENIWKDERNWI